MFNTFSRTGFSLRESRLIHVRESGFGEHMKDYGRDIKETYLQNKKGLDRGLGAIGAAASVILKGGDELFKGAIGQKFHSPHGIAGHTRADLKSLVGNVVHFRPLRAAGDVWSLATADVPLDTINLLTGNNLSTNRSNTRSDVHKTLAA